ncbi:MAG: hypothetical protein G01um10148_215 [Parcubacteria group bacterium Gr01-1014_8]|nr:MAG: hypothetical protein G01um10148_215 [Parcubacteria group bacterium Gr01-1014_8]
MLAITQSNYGGAQRYVYDLATSLPKDSYETVVVAGGRGILMDKLHNAGIRTISLESLVRNVSIFGDLRSFLDFYRLLRRERPQILHTNSSKMGGIGAIAARLAGVPHIIFTAHAWEFNAPRPGTSRIFIRLLAKLTVMLSHTTIAVSERVKEQIGPSLQSKITVVHNGIPSILFKSREEARQHLATIAHCPKEQNEFWIGTIAELHPVKGLSFGIEAFHKFSKDHPDARYLMIGGGAEKRRLEQQIRSMDLSDRVHLTDFVADASESLKAFDVFLLPSLSEGLNYAILEAGSAGVPVIASDTGGIAEIISSQTGILTPVSDARALCDALVFLYANQAARERLGSALRTRVTEKFSLAAMIRNTLAVYNASTGR